MLTARKKIQKEAGKEPTDIENQVAQALFDLETSSNDLKADLKDLYIVSAQEVDASGKKAVVVTVPFKALKAYHKIQTRLVRELEKKFSGKHVVIVGQRRILQKPSKDNHKKQQKRPRSRTLTAVHEALLEDVVYPTEIVGKRTRVKLDGSKHLKVYVLSYHLTYFCIETFIVGLLLSSPLVCLFKLVIWTARTSPTLSTSSILSLLYTRSSQEEKLFSTSPLLSMRTSKRTLLYPLVE
jgi:small subunit ribosomal protein S7e